MTDRPVLGDFLGAAHRQLESPVGWVGTGARGRDIHELTSSLHRIITVIARHSADSVKAFEERSHLDRRVRTEWPAAAVDALTALASAADALSPRDIDRSPAFPPVNSAVQRLDAAATSLTVGRDLLQTHFVQYQSSRQHHSNWAPVIASLPVTRALLAEVMSLGQQAAALGTDASSSSAHSGATDEAAQRVMLACQWLEQAVTPIRAAAQREPVPDADRELLYAIPASALPARRLPVAGQPVSDLCQAIMVTSARASHAAWTATGLAPGSPAISATSWRRIAAASTATSHQCHILLTMLAARTAQHGNAQVSKNLKAAAADAWLTRSTWLWSSRALGEVTTDVRGHTSRAAAEASDLALLTGRLAYADPNWSLASGPAQPARPAALLAPKPADVPGIMAAVHYAIDTLTDLATANLQQARAAADVGRMLASSRSPATTSSTPDPFAPAPEETITSVLDFCTAARTASARTAQVAGDVAIAIQAPSTVLVTARAATFTPRFRKQVHTTHAAPSDAPAPAPAEPYAPGDDRDLAGPFEGRLRDMGVSSRRLLRRATNLDRLGQKVITEAATDRLDQLPPPAVAGPARTPGTDGIPRSRPVQRGSRAPSPLKGESAAQLEFEAEP
jgi:hypothetical protein